jgi:hypothetical protein
MRAGLASQKRGKTLFFAYTMDTLSKVVPLSAKVHGHVLKSDEGAVVELHSLATATEDSISLTTCPCA